MAITSAVVMFAVIWFLVLFVVIPIRLETQGDRGMVLRGTHAGSPADPQMWKRARITTLVTLVLWGIAVTVISMGWVGIADFDLFTRFGGGTGPMAR